MVVSLSRTASGHLVDLLIMVRRWVYPSYDGGSGPTMSTCTWLNLAAGMSIFSTVVVGCMVILAWLQAAHSLHQATTSVARPGQTKWAATSPRVARRPAWKSSCACWKTALLWETGTRGQRAPVEVSHHRSAP